MAIAMMIVIVAIISDVPNNHITSQPIATTNSNNQPIATTNSNSQKREKKTKNRNN